jgi:hypothetical protein
MPERIKSRGDRNADILDVLIGDMAKHASQVHQIAEHGLAEP